MVREYVNDLRNEFKGYNGKAFAKDAMAGLTVTAVALPLALAFGVSSGATAASGLITAIIGGIVMSLLSGAYYQISGPTGAMAAILMSVVARYSLQGVFVATLIAGVLLILAGIFKLGKLVTFIPAPVITGFTSGIAVIIALGQIDNFFGVHSVGETAVQKLMSYGTIGFSPNWTAVAVGVVTMGVMVFFPKKWGKIVPSSLVVIILATAATIVFKLDVPVVGEIPRTLFLEQRLHIGDLNLADIKGLVSPAVSIAILCMIESLLCGASAGRMTGVKLRNNRELIAQGVGNMLVPFFGGVPATAAIARTSVAIKSGAVTRLTGVIHAVGLLISMFVLGPVMSQIPLSALAGVLMITAWRMNEWDAIKYIFSHKFKGAVLKFLATMIATIFLDLTAAILIGVGIALVLMVSRLSSIDINYEKVDMSRLGITDEKLCKRYSNAMVVYVSGSMVFSNTQTMEEIPLRLEGADTIIFSMRGVPQIDISAAQFLLKAIKNVKSKGMEVLFCGLSPSVKKMFQRSGIDKIVGEENFYWSVECALKNEGDQDKDLVGATQEIC